MIKSITKSAYVLAKASKGNPVTTTCVIMLYFLCFTMLEACVETLVFGHRFEHWLDPLFMILFMAYQCLAILSCAAVNDESSV